MVKVDVFVLRPRAFDQNELARAVEAGIGDASSRMFRFASAEDIVLAKLEWYRAGGDVSDRQWSDVVNVVRVKGRSFDWMHVGQCSTASSTSADFRQLERFSLVQRSISSKNGLEHTVRNLKPIGAR